MSRVGITVRFGLDCVVCTDAQGPTVKLKCDAVVIARGYERRDESGQHLRDRGYSVHSWEMLSIHARSLTRYVKGARTRASINVADHYTDLVIS